MRRCSDCGEEKPLGAFAATGSRGQYVRNECRTCLSRQQRERVARLPLAERQLQNRRHALRKKYGLTVEQYDVLWVAQDGRCLICEAPGLPWEPGAGHEALYVDHCHTSGRVRGLLCAECNFGLGRFRDRPDLLRRAADYLDQFFVA